MTSTTDSASSVGYSANDDSFGRPSAGEAYQDKNGRLHIIDDTAVVRTTDIRHGPGPVNGDPEVWKRNMSRVRDMSDPYEKDAYERYLDEFAARDDAPESVKALQQEWLDYRRNSAASNSSPTTEDGSTSPESVSQSSAAQSSDNVGSSATSGDERRHMWREVLSRFNASGNVDSTPTSASNAGSSYPGTQSNYGSTMDSFKPTSTVPSVG
ncbi:hypothetical protein IAU59_003456 [Kwoniella sp. CBS 9459]